MKKVFLSVIILAIPAISLAQIPGWLADSLQKIMDMSLPAGITNPGMIMSIDVPGKWKWSSQSGYATNGMSGSSAQMADSNYVFRTGSITKMFTAIAIFKLEEAGLLSVEDDIALYLRTSMVNDTIQSSEKVSIKQLLSHTSGIANSSDNVTCQLDALNDLTRYFSLEEEIFCGASQGEYFPPGFAWGYSNTNYSILAMIIQNVSGIDYDQFIADSIIIPLGLDNTFMPVADELPVPHMGCYYDFGQPLGLKDLTIVDGSLYKGWANLVSTTSDLVRFFSKLNNNEILSPSSVSKMKSILPSSMDYGMGLEFYDVPGNQYFGHSGNVGNTSGLFYCSLSTPEIPEGYYIAYNYNYEGVNSISLLDLPIYQLLKHSSASSVGQHPGKNTMPGCFPNPFANFVQVTATNAGQLLIKEISGSTVLSFNIESGINNIDLSSLDPGFYIAEIQEGRLPGGTQKIIKQ